MSRKAQVFDPAVSLLFGKEVVNAVLRIKIFVDIHFTNVVGAFRFIQSVPEVVVTLSGMSNFDQVKENINTF